MFSVLPTEVVQRKTGIPCVEEMDRHKPNRSFHYVKGLSFSGATDMPVISCRRKHQCYAVIVKYKQQDLF